MYCTEAVNPSPLWLRATMPRQIVTVASPSDVAAIVTDTEADRIVICFDAEYIGEDPNNGYEDSTKAIITAIEARFGVAHHAGVEGTTEHISYSL